MTEQEAKTKWCPFARTHVPGGVINRISRAMWRILKPGTTDFDHYKDIEADCNCIGSACMAWRWGVGDNERGWSEVAPSPLNNSGAKVGGYCGLAGKP